MQVKAHSKQDQRPERDRKDRRHHGLDPLDVLKVVVPVRDDQSDHQIGDDQEPFPRPPQLEQLQQQEPALERST
jgi:hypothetical protein